ncbi:MAG: dUTP diphosphatase [Oscillospiraceae bacterium]|nr:dUTP diphosphatase [Oscillospiraceae bacterium]
MTLKIKKLKPNAIIPKRETQGAAGLDLHACLESPVTIEVGEIFTVPTGIALSPEREDIVMFVIIRSSLGRKHGLTLANSVGVIDSDYRGEILVPIINHGDKPYTLAPDERFAQLVITPVIFPEVCETHDLDRTERGESGFGSTGKL